ncbi:hypothetical protein Kpol_1030p30 [Vanderwaltozyma polyspora DSM 70294]|uniref:Cation-transporting ATPase n=1 Tax=Vanderwaltozyma polyspora (strain ATCC 22028 / DSM 70294 / BCRC 21397 / CBS 2163 / NBRC 10782 / NRRL Y-8283 / UCD 57-17) TaxID=436907 RepID=A7TMU8_VANPO|nr:uncharacterized protein Kpol_1030p30 [Vanderwaltozyma polyspora DSM 70294]EDO16420.1 hypothetical protein Kpol_1030p30 [Vanderwaltozyma polyspora DSM 70294]
MVDPVYDNYEHSRNEPSNHRASFSSARTSSTATTLTSAIALNQNNNEAFDGAASETVPSSIVSFHRPHSFQSSNILGTSLTSRNLERRGRASTETDSLVDSSGEPSRSSSRNPHFRFFTEEQISNAEGSSTMENAEYNIEWDSMPVYEHNVLSNSRIGSRRSSFIGTSRSPSASQPIQYGSFDEHRSSSLKPIRKDTVVPPSDHPHVYHSLSHSSSGLSRYAVRDRIPYELEMQEDELLDTASSRSSLNVSTSDVLLDDENDRGSISEEDRNQQRKQISHAIYLNPQYHEKFYPNYIPITKYQRFYIAEEDLVIGIAGYKTSKFRLFIYNFFCIVTLGIFYLVMRWFPHYKVRFIGSKTELAKAEWTVIETENGELFVEPVKRTWYNRLFSTILPIEKSTWTNPDGTMNNSFSFNHASKKNPNIPILITFEYRYINFIYSPVEDIFRTNNNWADPNWFDLESIQRGLSKGVQEDRFLAFGKNQINLKGKTTLQILFNETLHPFYVFQIFSILLWSVDEYYYYAFCIFLISLISIIDSLLETKKTSKRLSELSAFSCEVRVFRDEFWTHINSSELVPGDVYEISDPALTVCPCDSILLNGDCVVNESMLTGESVPISKMPATEETMHQLFNDMEKSQISSLVSKSFLFNGTKVIRARVPHGQSAALAVVVRTGFSTVKGSLVRSMVFPKPTGFKFYQDSFKYIGFMTLIAMIGFTISCIQFVRIGLDKKTMILRALDIITIVVPPALPATLTIGTSFSLSRLKEKGIFCISPTRVNVAGKVDAMCFDKTGTLTEDELDVLGVHLVMTEERNRIVMGELINDIHNVFTNFSLKDCSSLDDFKARDFLISLLTCHSLRHVDGELLGDPLDFKMFKFTGWLFEEDFKDQAFHSLYEERHEENTFPENSGIIPAVVYPDSSDPQNKFNEKDPNNLLGIVRSFEFLSELRRMSVIVKPNGENMYWSFTKGAPEVITTLCNKSTIPCDFDELLHHYTHNGYRVIACAGKNLPKRTWLYSQRVSREEVETNLNFLGFIVFENKLKGATKGTLKSLAESNIRTIMCTGDNVLTAISIGKESGLVNSSRVYVPSISEITDEGHGYISWNDIDDPTHTLDEISLKPNDSQVGDYTLGVTGEVFRLLFKNDTDYSETYRNEVLLKTSIYARMSPDEKHELMEQLQSLDYVVGFCGDGANDCGALKSADIGISLSEAEASVAAPFTSRVFDISCVLDVIKEGRGALVTSFACFQYMSLYSAIQFITITILYSRGSNLGDFQFLYIDLILIVPIAITMSWSKPYDKLVAKRPTANLVSPKILVPLVVSILICLLFQIIPWIVVQRMPWYLKPVVGDDHTVISSDNTVLFFLSNFQYILVAVVLSVGPPYREPMSKNFGFIMDIAISIIMSIFLMGIDPDSFFGRLLQLSKISETFKVFIALLAIVNYFTQLYIPNHIKGYFKKKKSSKKYKNIIKTQNREYSV